MSENVKVITNNKPRETLYYWELTDKQRAIVDDYHDYLSEEEKHDMQFIPYKNHIYAISDFMSLHNKVYCPNPPDFMQGWDGCLSDSFFSGILIKFPCNYDTDFVVMGWYWS